MKKIFTFSALITLALLANIKAGAQTVAGKDDNKQTVAAAPEVLGISETEFDFGKIPQGKPVTHIFEVTNKGTDSLKIIHVQASCGCTTPEWEKDKVNAPGAKTNITVGYNAANEGQFTKTITITYNDNLTKVITIKGEVWRTPVTSAPENKELSSLNDL